MEYVIAYIAVAVISVMWLLGYAYIGMDRYDRRYICWGQTVAMAIISALLWPLVLILRPIFFKRPTETYEWNPARSRFDRERDMVLKNLKRCTNRVRFEAHHNGKMIGEFEFPSDAISAYLASRTDNDGYGNINDLPEIKKWVDNADLLNGQASEVPWVWNSFKLLVTELVSEGVGDCFCGSCRTHYFSSELESGFGDGSPGWVSAIVQCPRGHEVMKFDLMKPFCSHKRNSEPKSDQVISAEPRVPSFLKKGS